MTTVMTTDPQALLRLAQTNEGKRDPHALYASILEQTPTWRDEDSGALFLFGHRDCHAVMRSDAFGVPNLLRQSPIFEQSAALQFLDDALSNLDPPRHTHLRRRVQKAFSTPVLRRSEEHLGALIAERLAALRGRDTFDVVADYAAHIPNALICAMLGVPETDRERFEGWLAQQFRLISPTPPSPEVVREVDDATAALLDYVGELIAERQAHPRTDLISELVADGEGDPVSVRDATVTAAVLLAGGNDTTKSAITIGTRLLLEHPGERDRLRADERLTSDMFEEVVRFAGAVLLANGRRAHRDFVDGDLSIATGDIVVPVLASANRDPARFSAPAMFDIGRKPNPHIGFASGIHTCIGSMLARMVGGRAITALAQAFPTMKPISDMRDVNFALVGMFGLRSLDVAVV